MKVGDTVNLPFDEKGIILKIQNGVFYKVYWCKIIESKGVFNEVGDEVDFMEQQLLQYN